MNTDVTSLRTNEKGSVAVIVAVSAMLLMLIAGAAVDYGRMFYIRSALQSSLDAAAVAAGKEPFDTDAPKAEIEVKLRTVAQRSLDANLKLPKATVTVAPVQVVYTPRSGITPDSMILTLNASMTTSFMQIIGRRALDVKVVSGMQPPQPGPVDLALVLDTTDSMNYPPSSGGERKILTLRRAATALVNTVMASGSKNINVGVVPYSSYVNVGRRNPAPSWVLPIDRLVSYCVTGSYEFPDKSCIKTPIGCWRDGFWRANGCIQEDCSPKGKYICKKNGTYLSPWSGCIGARSVISNNPANIAANPSDDSYLDKISDPTIRRYSGQSDFSVQYGVCPSNQILGMTANKSDVLKRISELIPSGNTHIPTGLIWGWNILAPEEPYAARTDAAIKSLGGKKTLVLMTDGVNSTSPRLFDGSYFSNGDTRIVPEAWRDGTKSNELITKICKSMKDNGIVIFTVLYDVLEGKEGSEIEALLRNCASDGLFYRADNNNALLEAFKDIGDRLKYLKFTR